MPDSGRRRRPSTRMSTRWNASMAISSVKRSAVAEPVITVVVVDYRKGARVVANVRSLPRQYRADRLEIVVIDNSVDSENAALMEPLGSLSGVRALGIPPHYAQYPSAQH